MARRPTGTVAGLVGLLCLALAGCGGQDGDPCTHAGTSEPVPVGETRVVTLRLAAWGGLDFAGRFWGTNTRPPEAVFRDGEVVGDATVVDWQPAASDPDLRQRVDVVLPDGSTVEFRLLSCM